MNGEIDDGDAAGKGGSIAADAGSIAADGGDVDAAADGGHRIVSLAPSSTATLVALGVEEWVVGATTHCPLERPVVGGWATPDLDRVAALDPTLVLTSDSLQRPVRDDVVERGLPVCHVEPGTLPEVLDSFETIAGAVGCPGAGRGLAADCRERIDAVEARVAPRDDRPVVYCEEWSDPPMAAGNWVPDVVRTAGGRYPFVEPGSRSCEVDAETVRDADPDHVFLHLCGRGERVDPSEIRGRWGLSCPVHVVDDSLLNQPSPTLIDGLERVADVLWSGE